MGTPREPSNFWFSFLSPRCHHDLICAARRCLGHRCKALAVRSGSAFTWHAVVCGTCVAHEATASGYRGCDRLALRPLRVLVFNSSACAKKTVRVTSKASITLHQQASPAILFAT